MLLCCGTSARRLDKGEWVPQWRCKTLPWRCQRWLHRCGGRHSDRDAMTTSESRNSHTSRAKFWVEMGGWGLGVTAHEELAPPAYPMFRLPAYPQIRSGRVRVGFWVTGALCCGAIVQSQELFVLGQGACRAHMALPSGAVLGWFPTGLGRFPTPCSKFGLGCAEFFDCL